MDFVYMIYLEQSDSLLEIFSHCNGSDHRIRKDKIRTADSIFSIDDENTRKSMVRAERPIGLSRSQDNLDKAHILS